MSNRKIKMTPFTGRAEDTAAAVVITGGTYPHGDRIYSFITRSGRTAWGGETVAELRAKYPGALVQVLPFVEAYAQQHAADISRHCRPWEEITEEQHDEALNVLPPEKWQRSHGWSAFRMCEYMTGQITGHYFHVGGRYFTALRECGPYEPMLLEIRAQFSF